MALAVAWAESKDEVSADFQQFYGLNLWSFGLDGDQLTERVHYAAALCAQLPETSRLARKQDASNEWGVEAHFLRLLEYELRLLLWGLSDEKKRGEKPSAVLTPSERAQKQDLVAKAEAIESAVAAAFNLG